MRIHKINNNPLFPCCCFHVALIKSAPFAHSCEVIVVDFITKVGLSRASTPHHINDVNETNIRNKIHIQDQWRKYIIIITVVSFSSSSSSLEGVVIAVTAVPLLFFFFLVCQMSFLLFSVDGEYRG